jgi:3-hydroxybutyryl-CoA dehydrogenase
MLDAREALMSIVAIVGSGTMGAGIAQVAAQSGWIVRLMDVNEETVRRSIAGIGRVLDRAVEKGKLGTAERDETFSRLHVATQPADVADCDLIIEAVVEDLDTKHKVLAPLVAAAPAQAIIASNTSSLSITKIASGIEATEGRSSSVRTRFVGMHFFNPVPLMPLVEIIAGDQSDPVVVQRAFEIAADWGKTCVRAKDTPGFIVNRVARGFYLEALRMLDEGVSGVDETDRALRTLGGFRMGPFELMDLIGIDVNYAVTSSVWEQLGRPPRLAPHPIQKSLVDRNLVGRKSKQGFYSYQTEHPVPAVPVDRRTFELPESVYNATRRFVDGALGLAKPDEARTLAKTTDVNTGSITEQYVLARVLAAIINEAAIARDEGVASTADIDTAMKLGTNYPQGPFAWAERIGRHTSASMLRALNQQCGDGRFEPARGLA